MVRKLYRNRLYHLEQLPPGTKFRCVTGTTGTLLKCNQCRATVKLDHEGDGERVIIKDEDGNVVRDFIAKRSGIKGWAPGTEVYVLDVPRFPYRQDIPAQENNSIQESEESFDSE